MTTREIKDQKYQIRQFRGLNNIAPLTETTPVPLSLRKKGKVSSKRIANSTGRSPKNVRGNRIQLGKIPSFTKFVSDYARVHGMIYKDALKNKEVKALYRKNLSGENLTMLKHSFEQPRPKPLFQPDGKIGKLYFVDPRQNQDTFAPASSKAELPTVQDENKYKITRNMSIELKRLYLDDIRANASWNRYFMKFYNQNTFQPISEPLSRKIFDLALKSRSKGIFEASPFMELGMLYSSYMPYQRKMVEQERSFSEYYFYDGQDDYIQRLNLQMNDSRHIDINFDRYDFIFMNLASFEISSQLISSVIYDITRSEASVDIVFTYPKRLAKISEFIKDVIGFLAFRQIANTTLSEDDDQKLFDAVTDPTKYNLVRDETLAGEQIKISRFVDNLAGDTRSFFEELKQQANPMPSTTPLRTPLKTTRSAAFSPLSPEVFTYIPKDDLDDLTSTRLRRLNENRNRRLLSRMRSTPRKFEDPELEAVLKDLERQLGDASTETGQFSRVRDEFLPDETLDTSRTEEGDMSRETGQDTSAMSRVRDDIPLEPDNNPKEQDPSTEEQDTSKPTEERKVPTKKTKQPYAFYFDDEAVNVSTIKPGDLVILTKNIPRDNPAFYSVSSYDPETGVLYFMNKSDKRVSFRDKLQPNARVYKVSLPSKKQIKVKRFDSLKKQVPESVYQAIEAESLREFNSLSDVQKLSLTFDFNLEDEPEQNQGEEDEDPAGPSDQAGSGMKKGGSISSEYDRFVARFNPSFSLIGKNGVDYIYKLSF